MHQLTRQMFRDLEWILNTPSLLTTPIPEELGPIEIAEMDDLGVTHVPKRVGRYFEELIACWLRSRSDIEVLHQQTQLHDGNRTIGEIDFIYRTPQGDVVHCETAVKFYLYAPFVGDGQCQFIGPNSADNFEKKTSRLFSHQLQLGKKHFPEVTHTFAFMKGQIFVHPGDAVHTHRPELMSGDLLQGTWIYEDELDLLEELFPECCYYPAEKPFWLSPISVGPDQKKHSRKELTQFLDSHFRQARTPRLWSVRSGDSSDVHEIDRVFVVSRDWPGPQ
ncbi:hypothetical protein KOR42_11770 [Thalassoglobus neptunius]|uniref:DUF1853 family protein n=1 Tax=Thalassoglobus neptunius TaxID=1938619 RepID=A0A5C5X4J3_9PLAN|nr:DUF1853 family protein [Thalassoglobus neptunius]TWT57810.1 hypothetical protein KOR42_11770 [Thalassoglobus neptunius]